MVQNFSPNIEYNFEVPPTVYLNYEFSEFHLWWPQVIFDCQQTNMVFSLSVANLYFKY